jgi:hypothetical protein
MTSAHNGQPPEQIPTPPPEIRSMEPNERIIRANGVQLCLQTFGHRAHPPILINHGRGILDGVVGGGLVGASDGRLPVRHPLGPAPHGQIAQLGGGVRPTRHP